MSCHAKHVIFYCHLSGMICFRRVSHCEDNGETSKRLCILILLVFSCLLKLSAQWVKYALGSVYIDLSIGEMKKKMAKMSEFIHKT